METIHFLVISPYRGMNELIHEVLLSENQVQADCYIANLTEVDSLLDKLNLFNYDAIISRGGALMPFALSVLPRIFISLWLSSVMKTLPVMPAFYANFSIMIFPSIRFGVKTMPLQQ